jgi:hypothetical protein
MGRCEKSLTLEFISMARWVALLLLMGIGAMAVLLQYERHQEINWIFFSVCAFGGIVLFWIGGCLLRSECSTLKQKGRCVQQTTLSPINKL